LRASLSKTILQPNARFVNPESKAKLFDAVATQQMRKLGVPAALPRLDRLLA